MSTVPVAPLPAPRRTPDISQICALLEQEGFKPELDDDGDLVFRCEGLVYLLSIDEHDAPWGHLLVPFVWETGCPREHSDVMHAMDFVNRRSKRVKAYSVHQRVHLSVWLPMAPASSWADALLRCIRALADARTMLINAIRLPELVTVDQARLANAAASPATSEPPVTH